MAIGGSHICTFPDHDHHHVADPLGERLGAQLLMLQTENDQLRADLERSRPVTLIEESWVVKQQLEAVTIERDWLRSLVERLTAATEVG